MKLLWPGRTLGLDVVAAGLEALEVKSGPTPDDCQDDYFCDLALERVGEPESDGVFERTERAIMAYRICPPTLLVGSLPHQTIRIGDTLALRMNLPFGFGLGFGTRIQSAGRFGRDGWLCSGFSYTTLKGHPELGEAWFWVEKEWESGRVRIHLKSWSRPGNLMARIARPIARRMQIRANRLALDHLESQSRN